MGLFLGNTEQRLCASCVVRFFVRVHRLSAVNLLIDKRKLCAMTENLQANCVQRPLAGLCAGLPLVLCFPAPFFKRQEKHNAKKHKNVLIGRGGQKAGIEKHMQKSGGNQIAEGFIKQPQHHGRSIAQRKRGATSRRPREFRISHMGRCQTAQAAPVKNRAAGLPPTARIC